MFKNKVFGISFLISLFCHIILMSGISIAPVYGRISSSNYSSVYFLGPILEKNTFNFMREVLPKQDGTERMQVIVPQYVFDVKAKYPDEVHSIKRSEQNIPDIDNAHLRDTAAGNKIVAPDFSKENIPVILKDAKTETTHGEREIISKPSAAPTVPAGASGVAGLTQDRKNFNIELEFTISPDGTVEKVKPVVSSGYPEIDMIGMDYLKKWRFVPMEKPGGQKPETRRIKLELKTD